ncbi:MAG TPA: 30S ribosomal protein S6 [Solirubrobacteraceae bacterium]|nr:30S ribosomal protein S6 [Solirubrobacteraceae bacterium]
MPADEDGDPLLLRAHMTLPPPIYDLVLLLDTQLEEPARAKIVADARASIEAQGELVRHDPWGERALAYPIARKTSAEYHLLQFHAGSPQLLESLEHSLRIIDGILRFRIIKLKPGVPEAPDMRASTSAPRRSEGEPSQEASPEPRQQAAPEPAPEPAPEVRQEPAPEPAPDGLQDQEAQPDPAAAQPATEVEAGDRA